MSAFTLASICLSVGLAVGIIIGAVLMHDTMADPYDNEDQEDEEL